MKDRRATIADAGIVHRRVRRRVVVANAGARRRNRERGWLQTGERFSRSGADGARQQQNMMQPSDGKYRSSVREYFQLGSMMGESVEQTALKIIDLKLEGLELLEDPEGDPFFLIGQLESFLETRTSMESWDEFVKRTELSTDKAVGDGNVNASGQSEDENRLLNLVNYVEGQRRSAPEQTEDRSAADQSSSSATSSSSIQAENDGQQTKPRRSQPRQRRRRKGTSKFWSDFQMEYGYGIEDIIEIGGDEEWAESDADAGDGEEEELTKSEIATEDSASSAGGTDADGWDVDERDTPDPNAFSLPERLDAVEKLSVGDTFTGVVTRLAEFGVTISFYASSGVAVCAVCYLPDMDDNQDIAHPNDIVRVGERVRVRVVEKNESTGRLRVIFVDGDGNPVSEAVAEAEGVIEIAAKMAALIQEAEGVIGVDEGLVLRMRQFRGISLQILIDSEDTVGGFEVLVRSDGLQQRLFIMTTSLSRDDVGSIVKSSFAKLTE